MRKPAGEIFPGNSVWQAFRANTAYFSGISVSVATFRAVQTCRLRLSLYEVPRWLMPVVRVLARMRWIDRRQMERRLLPRRMRVAEMEVCCDGIPDNSPVDLFLDPLRKSRAGLYLLTVSSPDGTPGRAVTVWLSSGADRIGGHMWCSVGGKDAQECGIAGEVQTANPIADSPVPPTLCISTTTQCNLNCIHCISRWTRKRVQRLSAGIRSQIKQWADEGLLRGAATDYSGDILWADRRFGGDLDFFLGLNVPFHLDTNGVCLDRETSRRLMSSRVGSINVSLDAARDTTYRRIRIGAPPLQDIVQRMRWLAEERKNAGRMEVRLSIGFSLLRSNIDELPEAIALARAVGFDLVVTRHVEAYTANMAEESLWHDQGRFNRVREQALALAEKLGVQLGIPPAFEFCGTQRGHRFCPEPWRSALILGNGDVQVCCVPGPEMRMGNLNEQSMEEIWNGPRYQQFRLAVNSANPPAACGACPIYRKENNPDSYMPFRIREQAAAPSRPAEDGLYAIEAGKPAGRAR